MSNRSNNEPSPPKRRRMPNILRGGSNNNSNNNGKRRNFRHYVRALNTDVAFNKKFRLMNAKSTFMIEALPSNPESLLRVIFGHCIQSSLDEAQRRGIEPSRLGATITSQLLDPDIWIPIRQITPNTVDTILNRFLDVAQSKSREGSLWGAPFSVIVTTLDTVNLPQRDTISGRGPKHRTLKGAQHVIKEENLLRIRNNNNSYCLFYALEISRIYHCKGMTKQNFSNYINKMHSQQQQDAERLMIDAGIPLNRERYEAEIWVPRVVDHWNAMYPERKFKVFIFGTTGQYRPKYKYGPEVFRTPISLYYNNDHFDGIRCGVGTAIFGRDYYCFACELPFKNADTHKSSCTLHCKECGRIGVGRPCRDDGFKCECVGCDKTFMNDDCYRHHLSSNFCHKSHKCKKCGVIWNVRNNKGEGRSGHVCDERFCRTCGAFHNRERGCFIRQLKPRRPKTYRLVVYDSAFFLEIAFRWPLCFRCFVLFGAIQKNEYDGWNGRSLHNNGTS
ncbi:hypothetical protein niasHT_018675 [Heterodera trifolii]|uniref:C2H2-type domain-containing protein n=1 Tax=Heterodera trifolii TaxID=157864 RepID=A0ABD2LIR9_9BILA